ncbi:sigma-70 family RNA polymerase sigma factor [Heliobacillus mobilis]|uniref:Sigma-70 family RNA polymerase sigma factor n=1 Tax=Heliobacterium mobile TaxID=28064 RepID=A0A6I3SHH1_HELMO|nr:RNA polymerase sigma factor [Heliobacterium mobile]MTV48278.1 sigma-70 family RNA polymerase sigma factor [Heliobacterium mobile]
MDGQQKHIGEVFQQEQKNFMHYVRRKVTGISEMDAEDIVAEVFFNVFNRADLEIHVENLTAYLYCSIRNKVVDFLRKPKPSISLDQIDEATGTTLLERIIDPDADIHAVLHKKEVQERLNSALLELEPNQRKVWIATEIEGRSFKELAEKWNEPLGTLLSRKSRASKALKKILDNQD